MFAEAPVLRAVIPPRERGGLWRGRDVGRRPSVHVEEETAVRRQRGVRTRRRAPTPNPRFGHVVPHRTAEGGDESDVMSWRVSDPSRRSAFGSPLARGQSDRWAAPAQANSSRFVEATLFSAMRASHFADGALMTLVARRRSERAEENAHHLTALEQHQIQRQARISPLAKPITRNQALPCHCRNAAGLGELAPPGRSRTSTPRVPVSSLSQAAQIFGRVVDDVDPFGAPND